MSTVDTIFQVLGTIMTRYENGSDIKPDLTYLDHLLTREFHSIELGIADVWHEGSQSFYQAKLLKKISSEDALMVPPEVDSPSELDIDPASADYFTIVDPEANPEPLKFDEPDYFTPSIRRMVDRFLTWKLPQNFYPDGFVSFDSKSARQYSTWPVGTNILTAEQAREMFMYALDYTKDNVIGEIEAERYRQIYEEGHTFSHDDEHDRGEIAIAAACYASPSNSNERHAILTYWPWEHGSWKPSSNRRKDLIKAAALLIAEIERLDRLNKES